ncbi:MAG: LPS export ABC transporter permease LptG [Gammaproteobacteria bacterium]
MRKLDRYVGRSVLLAMGVVLLALGGLDFLFTAFEELGDTDGSYGTIAALRYVLFTFPRHVYELLPMTALIGALVGLGMLAAGNELVALQAAGITRMRIVGAVLQPTLLVILAGIALGEYVAPALELRGEVGKALASGEQVALSRYGHWERDGEAFMHFNAIEPDGVLYGVNLFVFDEQQRMVRTINAERAVYAGADWRLENGTEFVFTHAADGVSGTRNDFTTQRWELDLTPELLQVLIVDPDRMAIGDLYRYAQRFERQGQDADAYYLAFWKKALQPLTTLVLVLLAISFIFGPLRQTTMGLRVFTAICFGLTFTILQNLLHTLSLVYRFEPLVAVVLPLLGCALLGLMLFRRAA